MPKPQEFNILDRNEDFDLEFKLGLGRTGRGELPKDFWQTYSAMANTAGGSIILGVQEVGEEIKKVGVPDYRKVIKQIWDLLNNRKHVSVNLLRDNDIIPLILPTDHSRAIIIVKVPPATRQNKPVYLGSNPLNGTYLRNYEGDYRCGQDDVKRMLAEQTQDTRDGNIATGFTFDDLDVASITAYRNQFKSMRTDHPWLSLSDKDFLLKLGGWRKDRSTQEEGPTHAGLLMFGKFETIQEVFPDFFIDYQERPEPKAEPRWIDRVEPDGTWPGNLYSYYNLVIRKLQRDLKVPFRLKEGRRIGETPIHEALREALVNCLIHADYSGSVSILVVKRPDMFGFRNPGRMRISVSDAVKGGISDCRNRALQTMFRQIGLGEQAGSGVPKIYLNWEGQHWRAPILLDKLGANEQTILELRMVSLLPDETLAELDKRFGDRFRRLPELHRLALATVEIEEEVTHSRLKQITNSHPSDVTKALTSLVKKNFLESSGTGRGTSYYFPGGRVSSSIISGQDSDLLEDSSQHSEKSSQHSENGSSKNALLNPNFEAAIKVAKEIRTQKKSTKQMFENTLQEVLMLGYFSLRDLARILNREPSTIQNHYLGPLLRKELILLKYPDNPTHPHQEYTIKKADVFET